METLLSKQVAAWRRGWIVFAVLAVLTIIEFIISLALSNPWPLLTVVALAKAGLIIAYFMRLGNIWREEE